MACMVERQKAAHKQVTIGLVGKYVALQDAYLSVAEALRHGGIVNDAKVEILWIDSEKSHGKLLRLCWVPVMVLLCPADLATVALKA